MGVSLGGRVPVLVLAVVSVLAACTSSPPGDRAAGDGDGEAATATATETSSDAAPDEAATGEQDPAASIPHVSDFTGTLPGGRVVFTSDRGGDSDLWLVAPDGSGLQQLTDAEHADWRGDWSPDGSTIVFASQRAAFGDDGYIGDTAGGLQPYGLYLVTVEGGSTTHLLGGWEDRDAFGVRGSGRAFNNSPVWSPDGTRVAFTSDAAGEQSLYVMEAVAGSEVQQVTDPSLEVYYPTWSPDGTRIAVSGRTDPEGALDLLVVGIDGSGAEALADDGANARMPAWSPDGSAIVFVSDRDSAGDLHLLDVASGEISELLASEDELRNPSWSPDGQWLVFESRTDEGTEIDLVRADGTDRLRLTDDPARDGFPDWGP